MWTKIRTCSTSENLHKEVLFLCVWYYTNCVKMSDLNLILLTWKIWWARNNASKWLMGFNSAFKGLTNDITPWSRVLPERLTGLQLVKQFPAFTSARHLSLSWAGSIHSKPSHPTSWRYIFIFSSLLRLGLPSGLFLSGLSVCMSAVSHTWSGLKDLNNSIVSSAPIYVKANHG